MHGNQLPDGLIRLIETGKWPSGEPHLQDVKPLLGRAAAHVLSPEEQRIVLMPPPFHTFANEIAWGDDLWTQILTNVGEIDYEKALVIADFGIGSDSPIILYYGKSQNPCVMYLRWSGSNQDVQHEWIETHPTFDDFAMAVGLYHL